MVKTIVLLAAEVAFIVFARSVLWTGLIRVIAEGRIPKERSKPVAASLLRTSGHLWLLLAFVPTAILVTVFVSAEDLDTPTADLLAVAALGLMTWCGWKAVFYYRWAWRIRGL
jgi:hypothetical protein